jgi:hypothetical protein
MLMKHYRPLPLLAACLGAALSAAPSAARGRGAEPALPEQDAPRLVRDLGSDNFEAREAATRRLLEWEAPPPALRAALRSGDREVVRRATQIISEITRREENAAFGKLTEFARRGEIDRLAELLARRPKWDDENACWRVVAGLGGRLSDLEKQTTCRRTGFPPLVAALIGDFPLYVERSRPQKVAARLATLKHGRYLARAEHIAGVAPGTGFSDSLLVSSRGVRAHSLYLSVVFAGGPVEAESISSSIVVCDADVNCYDASRCLIIARGDVRLTGWVTDCRIITSGSVRFLPRIPAAVHRNNQVTEHEPNPLGFVKWFDPARVGVTVEAAAGGVRVKAAGKSFARAGLRAGDLVAAIDGEAVKSPDDFRLLLRAKLADGGKMVFAVRRAGQDLKVPVRCKD